MPEPAAARRDKAELPWIERVPMLSVNPDAATRDDVARLAADHMALRQVCNRMIDDFCASTPFDGDGEVAAYLWPIANECDREFPETKGDDQ